METDFITWLTTELNRRGWSQSELARRADIVQSGVSMVLNGQHGPGFEFCAGIAKALNVPPELVMRKAGILPELPAEVDQQQLAMLTDYYRRLSPRVREELVAYAAFKYERSQEQGWRRPPRPRIAPTWAGCCAPRRTSPPKVPRSNVLILSWLICPADVPVGGR